jgi:hypothetical protein
MLQIPTFNLRSLSTLIEIFRPPLIGLLVVCCCETRHAPNRTGVPVAKHFSPQLKHLGLDLLSLLPSTLLVECCCETRLALNPIGMLVAKYGWG